MRKKTIKNLCDNVFWYIVYLAPLIITALVCFGAFQGDWYPYWDEANSGDWTMAPWNYILNGLLFEWGFTGEGVIFSTLHSLFGANGILPLIFFGDTVLSYMCYFVTMVIVHLVVDFILFIPRLAHKFMNKFTQGD